MEEYVPALLIVSGNNHPFVYFQDTSSRNGAVWYLNAIDGGLSDTTYLTEAPRAKIVKIFKERTFFANCSDAANRIYFTGADSAGAIPMNVFPSGYNMDVGSNGSAITDMVPVGDRMYIFTTQGTHILSGDGAGGIWSISKISEIPAVKSTNAVTANDGTIFFASPGGIYAVRDTSFKNISHPRVHLLWDDLFHRSSGNDQLSASLRSIQMTYNKTDDLLMVNFRSTIGSCLVYYCGMDAWSRWGNWDVGETNRAPDASAYDLYYYSQQYMYTDFFSKQGSVVLHLGAQGLLEFRKNECLDGTLYTIHWFIETNDYLDSDESIKLLRYIEIEAEPTGEWYMSIVPMHDGQSKEEAIRDKAGGKWDIIIDDASSAVHAIGTSGATSNFTAAADGPVDVILLDTMHKMSTNQTIKRPTSNLLYTVEFTSSQDYSLSGHVSAEYVPGRLLMLPAGVANKTDINMLMEDTGRRTLNGTNKFRLGIDKISNTSYEIKTVPANITGRRFALWFSNCGMVHPYVSTWAQPGMPFNLKGWSLWYMPKGRLRPNA
jgi:hypothetical protein